MFYQYRHVPKDPNCLGCMAPGFVGCSCFRVCGNEFSFEVEQSIKDDALTECPTCGGPVERLITNTHRPVTRHTPIFHGRR